MRETEGLDIGNAVVMEDMTAWKGTSSGLIQMLHAHRALLTRYRRSLWLRLRRHNCLRPRIFNLTVADGHTKPLVFAFRPVLPLAWLTAVENKFASGTGLERVTASTDTAVGALSLVACAGLAGAGGKVTEKFHNMSMAIQHRNIQKMICLAIDLTK